MELIETIRNALRIKSTAFDESEIKPLIEACKTDLQIGGVDQIVEEDPLFIHAVILYAKGNFGFLDDSSKYAEAYEKVKQAMALSTRYGAHMNNE